MDKKEFEDMRLKWWAENSDKGYGGLLRAISIIEFNEFCFLIEQKLKEAKINEQNTLSEIVKQLEWCEYECEASYLKNNVAFIKLKEMAGNEKKTNNYMGKE